MLVGGLVAATIDMAGRVYAEAVSNAIGQRIVVSNVGGSGGLGPFTVTMINNTPTYALWSEDDLSSPSALHLF